MSTKRPPRRGPSPTAGTSSRPPHLDVPPELDRVRIGLTDVRASAVRWLWHGRIPLGRFTVLDGDPGLGKSALLLDLAARLTVGRPMPDEPEHPTSDAQPGTPAAVLVLSAEDDLADTIRPRLEAAGADLARVVAIPYIPIRLGERLVRFPTHVPFLGALAQRAGVRLVIVDPLVAYLNPRVNTHSDAALRDSLASLLYVVEALGLAVVLVRHLAKHSARNALYRGAGTIGLIGAARSGLLVSRDPDDPSGERRLLLSTKSNLSERPPTLVYRLATAPNGAALIRWEGRSAHTPETALSPPATAGDRSRRETLEEATAILVSILADGPLPAEVVRRQAASAGLGPSLLWRAKSALGIRSRKRGGRDDSDRSWLWALPGQFPHTEQDFDALDPKS